MQKEYPNHGRIDGPIVMIGFGSIGKRHPAADRAAFRLRPRRGDGDRARNPPSHTFLHQRGIRHIARSH